MSGATKARRCALSQMIFAVAERGERIMVEYIDREALVVKFDRMGLGEHSFVEKVFSDGVRTIIAEMPAADVAPVRHGQWERIGIRGRKEIPIYPCCSACGTVSAAYRSEWEGLRGA